MKHIPRKRFGQHFLVDTAVLEAIADAIAPRPGERLLEIGPGLGALTERLLARTEHLDAVEIDRDLVARLRRRWPEPRLRVFEADALAFDLAAHAQEQGGKRIRLVGNLPYNISTPLLLRLLPALPAIADAHFMLQKEVVDRVAASHGCAEYGRLSVMIQVGYYAESLFDVPPEAFDPPPRVESSVLRLIPRPTPLVRDVGGLEQLLAVAFTQRRKMLRGTLLPWLRGQGFDLTTLPDLLDPTWRPEDVPVTTWVSLADRLHRTV